MGQKYEFTDETMTYDGCVLHRIRRLSDGKLGGWIESEENLSQEGNCWVDNNAKVYEDARVYGNAKVCDEAEVSSEAKIYGNAKVYDNAWVCENAQVYENAKIYGNAKVYDNAKIYGDAQVYGDATVYNEAQVYGNAIVYGGADVSDNAKVYDNAQVYGSTEVWGDAQVYGNAKVYDEAHVWGSAKVHGNAEVYDDRVIDSGEYTADELGEEFDAAIELAKYIVTFTRCGEDYSFDVDIKGHGRLWDLDYENHPECWGSFNATIIYSTPKTSFEITVEFPDYADYSIMNVKLSSKKLGIDMNIDTVEELRAELKRIAEKLTECNRPDGSNTLKAII